MKLALAFTETSFSADVVEEIRYTRLDNGQAVDVAAQLQSVPFAPQTVALMQKCLDGSATPKETAEFRECWQARVRTLLLEHGDDPEVFVLRTVKAGRAAVRPASAGLAD